MISFPQIPRLTSLIMTLGRTHSLQAACSQAAKGGRLLYFDSSHARSQARLRRRSDPVNKWLRQRNSFGSSFFTYTIADAKAQRTVAKFAAIAAAMRMERFLAGLHDMKYRCLQGASDEVM